VSDAKRSVSHSRTLVSVIVLSARSPNCGYRSAGAAPGADVEAEVDGHEFDGDGVGPADPVGLAVGDGQVVDVGERGGAGHAADGEQDPKPGKAFKRARHRRSPPRPGR
jgi:hypothetical protein